MRPIVENRRDTAHAKTGNTDFQAADGLLFCVGFNHCFAERRQIVTEFIELMNPKERDRRGLMELELTHAMVFFEFSEARAENIGQRIAVIFRHGFLGGGDGCGKIRHRKRTSGFHVQRTSQLFEIDAQFALFSTCDNVTFNGKIDKPDHQCRRKGYKDHRDT